MARLKKKPSSSSPAAKAAGRRPGPKTQPSNQDRSVAQRWGERLGKITGWRRNGTGLGGYVPVVRSFLRLYARLGLKPTQAMLILHLMDSKWDAQHPRLKSKVLATRLGMEPQQVKRYLKSLSDEFGLTWTYDRSLREYTFDLSALLELVAERAEQVREEHRARFEEGE